MLCYVAWAPTTPPSTTLRAPSPEAACLGPLRAGSDPVSQCGDEEEKITGPLNPVPMLKATGPSGPHVRIFQHTERFYFSLVL